MTKGCVRSGNPGAWYYFSLLIDPESRVSLDQSRPGESTATQLVILAPFIDAQHAQSGENVPAKQPIRDASHATGSFFFRRRLLIRRVWSLFTF